MVMLLSRFYLYFYAFYYLLTGFIMVFLPKWGMNVLQLNYTDTVLTHSYGIISMLIGSLAFLPAMDFKRFFLNFVIIALGAILSILQYLYEWFVGSAGFMQLGIPFLAACGYVYFGMQMMSTPFAPRR